MRILIVDSDPAARRKVIESLLHQPEGRIIQEAETGLRAVSVLEEFQPHLLVCEAEAAGLDGFSLLECMPKQDRPATIFMSTSGHLAARAFDVGAVDYLVKPISEDRLLQAVERATMQSVKVSPQTNVLERSFKKLSIKSGRSVTLVEPDELDWADAEGKYVRLHLKKEVVVLKMSISALEQELDPARFVRIHRSTIVNLDCVRQIQPWRNRRTYQVTLHDGTRLVLSRKSKLLPQSR